MTVKHVTIGEATAAVSVLAQAVRQGTIRWDNADPMAVQFSHVVVMPGPGGPRIGDRVSRGPVEAVKAVSWAHWRAVHNAPEGPAIY
jgi:hypothetical protein